MITKQRFMLELGEPIVRWVHPYSHVEQLGRIADEMFGHPELTPSEVSQMVNLTPFVAIPMPVHLGAAGRFFVASHRRWHPLWWLPDHVIEPQRVGDKSEPTDMRMIRLIIEFINAGLLDRNTGEWEDLSRLQDISPEAAAAEMSERFGGPDRRESAVADAYGAFTQVEADGFALAPQAFLEILSDIASSDDDHEKQLAEFVPTAARWFSSDREERKFWSGVLQSLDGGTPAIDLAPLMTEHLEDLDRIWAEVFRELESADSGEFANAE